MEPTSHIMTAKPTVHKAPKHRAHYEWTICLFFTLTTHWYGPVAPFLRRLRQTEHVVFLMPQDSVWLIKTFNFCLVLRKTNSPSAQSFCQASQHTVMTKICIFIFWLRLFLLLFPETWTLASLLQTSTPTGFLRATTRRCTVTLSPEL